MAADTHFMTKQEIDITSPTWRSVQQFAEEKIATLRSQNDSFALDATATAVTRGQIAAFKSLLALAEKPDPELIANVGPDY